jgi:hypothetical protein
MEVDSLMLRDAAGFGAGLTLALAARRGRLDGVSGAAGAVGTREAVVAAGRGAEGRGVPADGVAGATAG